MKRLNALSAGPVFIALLISFSLILAACSSSAATATSSNASPVTGSEAIRIANDPKFGQLLVTSDGKTLYTNTVDTPEKLLCTTAACTGFWPPYVVAAKPTAAKEISGLLETTTRPDGSQQVTYNHQPLYTFYLDKQPGDVKGDGFTDLGGTWHVVTLGSSPAGSGSDNNSGSGGYQY